MSAGRLLAANRGKGAICRMSARTVMRNGATAQSPYRLPSGRGRRIQDIYDALDISSRHVLTADQRVQLPDAEELRRIADRFDHELSRSCRSDSA